MKFVKVKRWTWRHYLLGVSSVITDLSVTEVDMRIYINTKTPSSGGNWEPGSLEVFETKVKEKVANAELLDLKTGLVGTVRPRKTLGEIK